MSLAADNCRRLDEFLRIYQIGFVAVWPLLGLASVQAWSTASVLALVGVAIAFNIFGGVLNDVYDMESDRQAPERSDRWLVSGVVPLWAARMLVFAQLPVMGAIHLAAGFHIAALGWLTTAVAGQAWYDAFGKRSRIPPLAEAGQAVAAASLVLYGATVVTTGVGPLAWPTAIAGAALLMLVNAFHGGLRDIGDDLRARVITTPIWFGCGVEGRSLLISAAMSAYSGLWLGVLIAASLAVAYETMPRLWLLILLGCAINASLFVALHRVRKPAWDLILRLHVGLLMVPIMAAFIPLLGYGSTTVLLAIYLGPVTPLCCRFLAERMAVGRVRRPAASVTFRSERYARSDST